MTFKSRFMLLFLPTKRCTACGRRLTTKKDRARGMGAGCARKFNAITVLPKINKDGVEDL